MKNISKGRRRGQWRATWLQWRATSLHSHWRICSPHNGSLILSQEFMRKLRSFEVGSRRRRRALSPITSVLLVSCVGKSVGSSRRMKMSFEEDSEQLLSRYHPLAQNAYWAKGEFGRCSAPCDSTLLITMRRYQTLTSALGHSTLRKSLGPCS